MPEQTKNVQLAGLAAAFDVPATRIQRELSLLGWSLIVNEANRLARADDFDRTVAKRRIIESFEDLHVTPTWTHFVEAAKDFLPHLASRAIENSSSPPDLLVGYVYVLFDGMTGLSKIGHTKTVGRRQRTQMSGHGSALVNVVNAKVPDCIAAETKCHKHFAQYRTNGEWFSAKLEDIIQYVDAELDWLEIDFENLGTLAQYILHCRLGNREKAKAVLMEGRRGYSRKPNGLKKRCDNSSS